MKGFLKMLAKKTGDYISGKEKEAENKDRDQESILSMIRVAIQKKSSIHIIFQDKSFTGDIIKLDQERQQLIVKNFRQNMSVIIRIKDIKRIRLVPQSISVAQRKGVKINWLLFLMHERSY